MQNLLKISSSRKGLFVCPQNSNITENNNHNNNSNGKTEESLNYYKIGPTG